MGSSQVARYAPFAVRIVKEESIEEGDWEEGKIFQYA